MVLKEKILKEIEELSQPPLPQEDWDLICVLSGYENDFGDIPGQRNENKDRLETGLAIVRKVAAIRLSKKTQDINVEDLTIQGPIVYYIGTNLQNNNLKKILNDFCQQQAFPKENIIVSENLGIRNTREQIKSIPTVVMQDKRKIVIVSGLYHLPRVKRYILKDPEKFNLKRIIFYASQPQKASTEKIQIEVDKISQYIKQGILPSE